MCDQDHFQEDLKKYTRRDVGVLAAAVGVVAMLPRASNAVDVKESDVTIKTPDGTCDAYFVAPVERRERRRARVARHLRSAPRVPADGQAARRVGLCGARRESVLPHEEGADRARTARTTPIPDVLPLAQTLNATTHVTDAKAFIAWLDSSSAVSKNAEDRHHRLLHGRPDVMRTAAAVPDRVGAGRTFHGGGLVTTDAGQPASADPADEGAVPASRSPRTTTCASRTRRPC